MLRILFVSLVFLFSVTSVVHAVPASPDVTDIQQPDGTVIKTRMMGDEFQGWTETADSGHTIIRNKTNGYLEYAEQAYDGTLQGTGIRVLPNGKNAPATLKKRLKPPRNSEAEKQMQLMLQDIYQERLRSAAPRNAGAEAAVGDWTPVPVSGSRKMLLVLVGFANRALNTTPTSWNSQVFDATAKSVTKYYKDNSFNTLNITPVTTTQPGMPNGVISVTLPTNHPNTGGDYTFASDQAWGNSALQLAASYVNFNSLDTNSDGKLDTSEVVIYFIAAGYETSAGSGLTPSMWAHAWRTTGTGLTAGTKNVQRWALNGEYYNTTTQMPMGVIAHELGHQMGGLPDLYDTSQTNQGMGEFSLMAGGSWGGDTGETGGTTPTALDAWSREFLGWATPITPTAATTVSLAHSLSAQNAAYKLINTGVSTSEYFLAENRYPTGWDLGLKRRLGSGWAGGMLITHIDITAGTAGSNDINKYTDNGGRQGVIPVQASTAACEMLAEGATCRGHATTLFYSGNNASWTPTSTPNSNYYSGTPTNFYLTGISAPAGTMTGNFSNTAPAAIQLPVAIDNDGWTVTTGGSGSWSGQSGTTHDGVDAAQSGDIADSQSTYMQTTLTSNGTLSFYWKVSSESGYDYLRFYIDDVEQGSGISGEVDWTQVTGVSIPAGSHTLKWTYSKDSSASDGSDAGWVDQVVFTPSTPPTNVQLTINSTNPASGVAITVTPTDTGGLGNGTTPFTRTYAQSSSVTLTAPATAGGNNFSSWTGCTSTSSTTCTVSMTAAKTVTANYSTPAGISLTINSTNPASGVAITVTPNDTGGLNNGTTPFTRTYALSSSVTLTAPATAGGNNFSSWTGCTSASSTTCNVSMDAAKTVTANYTTPTGITLPVAIDNNAWTVTTGGGANWSGQATTTHDGVDAAQSGDITDSQSTYMQTTVTSSGSLSFWWKVSSEGGWDFLTFYINGVEQTGAAASISGAVDWTQVTGISVLAGDTIKWEYSKDSSYSSGSDAGWVDQVVLTSGNLLTVTKTGNGGGTVTPNSGTLNWTGATGTAVYTPGTVVTLTAVPGPGSLFAGWSGACSGTATTCNVTMSVARSVTATFNGPRILLLDNSLGEMAGALTKIGYSYTAVDAAGFTAATLTNYDVIMTAWSLPADKATALVGRKTAIAAWTSAGGRIFTSSANGASGGVNDWSWVPLSVTPAAVSGEDVVVVATNHALMTTPHLLNSTDMSSWGTSYHNTWSAYDPAFELIVKNSSDQALVLAASYGSGMIVVSGSDPEYHTIYGPIAGQYYLENLLTWGGYNSSGRISGTVTDATTGVGIAGVTVTASGASTATAVTAANGSYSINYLTPGTYSMTAVKTGYLNGTRSGVVVTSGMTATANMTMTTVNKTLSVAIAGSGSGTVNSSPAGIACPGTCAYDFPTNSSVSLLKTVSVGSVFTGWSGACSGTGACSVSMTAPKSVTATFDLAPPVRINGAVPVYYQTLQAAYDAATTGAEIQLKEGVLVGSLLVNRSPAVDVSITGGYNAAYTAISSDTTLQGSVQLRSGKVTIEKVNVKP